MAMNCYLIPECAKALAKYRINPGNVGFGRKKDAQFSTMIDIAIKYDKPIRIGVNWGSENPARVNGETHGRKRQNKGSQKLKRDNA